MYCLFVAYPNNEGGTFDFDYYLKTHIPMVSEMLGDNLVRVEVRKGLASGDGSAAPFLCLANIWIKSIDSLQATLRKNGQAINEDIPRYTNIAPLLQVDEVLSG
ncbi:hypothetical protein TUM18999_50920 [Pseudomonas tohonis]|uniref:EthD domain-containing protein n=1 Tax=Pseudomonas tohonis TaxID=2725477 RepID=A0A6J4EER9_9PSED|nr:EthD family reductase [Pseudomonas tohonis]BCG26901.1 hypothetical protein TUM18999_50920 [Pseudomonas tohonis]GJN50363.1 hypothetical protein TUM20286_01150 [Pseudomonas tohonis]